MKKTSKNKNITNSAIFDKHTLDADDIYLFIQVIMKENKYVDR